MGLYFGNVASTISTLLVTVTLFYIIVTIVQSNKIEKWGRRTAVLGIIGLLVCIFVATRDEYHISVQSSFDDTVSAGLFAVDSIQSTLCCIGGAVIAFSILSSVFVKKQKYRKIMFYVLGFAIIFKTLVIEISRLVM